MIDNDRVILEMLSAGEIYLWSVRLLSPHLTEANHRDVLESARGKKSRLAIQEIVAGLAPRPDAPTIIRKISAPPPEPVLAWTAPPSTDEPTPMAPTAFHPPLPAPVGVPAPAPPSIVTPLSPDRYKFQLTISGDVLEKLRLAKDMLSHVIPSGDDEVVLDRALTALLVDLARKKFADTRRPRRSSGCKDDSDIPAAVKRIVSCATGGDAPSSGRTAIVARSDGSSSSIISTRGPWAARRRPSASR